MQRLVRVTPGDLAAHSVGQAAEAARANCAASARDARWACSSTSMNSNTFQDQPGQRALLQVRQPEPHRSGGARSRRSITTSSASRSAARSAPRRTPCGSATAAISPARSTCAARSIATSQSLRAIYAALPDGWRLFIEHKLYEPAFYSTVLNDWGTSYHCARELGDRGLLARRSRASRAERQHRADRRAADPVRRGSAGSTSTTASSETTTSTPDRSSRSSCSWSSTSWSTPSSRACRASRPPTCSTSRTTSPIRSSR